MRDLSVIWQHLTNDQYAYKYGKEDSPEKNTVDCSVVGRWNPSCGQSSTTAVPVCSPPSHPPASRDQQPSKNTRSKSKREHLDWDAM